jgi:hypothetical protein
MGMLNKPMNPTQLATAPTPSPLPTMANPLGEVSISEETIQLGNGEYISQSISPAVSPHRERPIFRALSPSPVNPNDPPVPDDIINAVATLNARPRPVPRPVLIIQEEMTPEIKKAFNEVMKCPLDRAVADLLILVAKGSIVIYDEKDNCSIWNETTRLWESGTKSIVIRKVSDILTTFLNQRFNEALTREDNDERRDYIKRIMSIIGSVGNAGRIPGIITFARFALMEGSDKFKSKLDNNRNLLPIRPNRVIELKVIDYPDGTHELTRTIRLREKKDYLSKQLEYDYDPEIHSDQIFDKFIEDFFLGDRVRKEYLFEVYGNSILGNPMQIYLYMVGPGSSGKSTMDLLSQRTLDCYSTLASRSALITRGNRGGGISETGLSPQITALEGYRYATIGDIQAEERLNHATLNQIIGGDSISARELHKNMRNVGSLPMIAFTSNYDVDYEKIGSPGLIRKLAYFLCLAKFRNTVDVNPEMLFNPTDPTHRARDPMLIKQFENPSDRIKSCMLNMILDGAQRLVSRGFTFNVPEDIGKRVALLVNDADIVKVWIDESYDRNPEGRILARDALIHFKEWLTTNHYTCKVTYTSISFGIKLSGLGVGFTSVSNSNRYHLRVKVHSVN